MNNSSRKAAALLLGAASTAFAVLSVSERMTVAKYKLSSDKIKGNLRLLHLSDLHSSSFGKGQSELTQKIGELSPDAVFLTGDMADNRVPNENAWLLAEYIGSRYPCFYVAGNHEVYTGESDKIKEKFRSFGITVLEGEGTSLALGNDILTVCGIDDPYASPDAHGRMWEDQLACCDAGLEKERFSILLTHRPEPVSFYSETAFDLILAGHAHGGQVRVPGLLNGLYAPHQGWLPQYAGGRYELKKGQNLIVSRGLSKYVRPRVFNRPELVWIELFPKR